MLLTILKYKTKSALALLCSSVSSFRLLILSKYDNLSYVKCVLYSTSGHFQCGHFHISLAMRFEYHSYFFSVHVPQFYISHSLIISHSMLFHETQLSLSLSISLPLSLFLSFSLPLSLFICLPLSPLSLSPYFSPSLSPLSLYLLSLFLFLSLSFSFYLPPLSLSLSISLPLSSSLSLSPSLSLVLTFSFYLSSPAFTTNCSQRILEP